MLSLAICLLVVGCERDKKQAGASRPIPENRPLRQLPGDPESFLRDVLYVFEADFHFSETEFETLSEGGTRVHRCSFSIAFDSETKVGEMNDLLEASDAAVVLMRDDYGVLEVHFPDPGSLEALYALEARVEEFGFVDYVSLSAWPGTYPVRPLPRPASP